MCKKAILVLALFIVGSTFSFGQEKQSILTAPENWKKEIIDFPISFAPSIPFTGMEDLRFTPHWSDATNAQFWTYMFVWYIEKDSNLTTHSLSKYMNLYYDGLMGVSSDLNPTDDPQKTQSVFTKTNEGFNGQITMYDRFFTKKEIILYVKVKEDVCTKTNKQLIRFELSPTALDDPFWEIFNAVNVIVDCE